MNTIKKALIHKNTIILVVEMLQLMHEFCSSANLFSWSWKYAEWMTSFREQFLVWKHKRSSVMLFGSGNILHYKSIKFNSYRQNRQKSTQRVERKTFSKPRTRVESLAYKASGHKITVSDSCERKGRIKGLRELCLLERPSISWIKNSIKPNRDQHILRHVYYATMQIWSTIYARNSM